MSARTLNAIRRTIVWLLGLAALELGLSLPIHTYSDGGGTHWFSPAIPLSRTHILLVALTAAATLLACLVLSIFWRVSLGRLLRLQEQRWSRRKCVTCGYQLLLEQEACSECGKQRSPYFSRELETQWFADEERNALAAWGLLNLVGGIALSMAKG